MSEYIKASTLAGFARVVERMGGHPEALLEVVGLTADLESQPESVLPYRSLIDLLETCSSELACPDFGLRLAQEQKLEQLGPLAHAALNCSNVAEGLTEIVQFMDYLSTAIFVGLDLHTDEAFPRLVFDIKLQGVPPHRQILEFSMAVAFHLLDAMSGGEFAPRHVTLRSAPGFCQSKYKEHFRAPVYFAQGHNAIVFDRDLLSTSITTRNTQLHDIIFNHLLNATRNTGLSLIALAKQSILRLLPINQCSLKNVARDLNVHERTLQRRLKAAGLVFEDMIDNMRKLRADQYLSEPGIQMVHVADLVGYSEQSSFNRACRRWFGVTPRQRRQHLVSEQRVGERRVFEGEFRGRGPVSGGDAGLCF